MKKYIFLAEDDIDDQEFIIEALNELDHELVIECASTGETALQKLNALEAHELPQLIVLDYNLPQISGLELLRLLANSERYKGVTKLVWSTSSAPHYQQSCLAAGATAYLIKPSDVAGIAEMAETILRHLPIPTSA